MTDREKVIRSIDGCINIGDYCNDCDYDGCIFHHGSCEKDLLADALALLKEQEAMLVEIDGQLGGIKYGRCPKCGKGLNEEVYPHWCGFCGQEVKWE